MAQSLQSIVPSAPPLESHIDNFTRTPPQYGGPPQQNPSYQTSDPSHLIPFPLPNYFCDSFNSGYVPPVDSPNVIQRPHYRPSTYPDTAHTMPHVFNMVEDLDLVNIDNAKKEEIITSKFDHFFNTYCVALTGNELKLFLKNLGLTNEQKKTLIQPFDVKNLDKLSKDKYVSVMIEAIKCWKKDPSLTMQQLNNAMLKLPARVYEKQKHILIPFIVRPENQEVVHLREQNRLLLRDFHHVSAENTQFQISSYDLHSSLILSEQRLSTNVEHLSSTNDRNRLLEEQIKTQMKKVNCLENKVKALSRTKPEDEAVKTYHKTINDYKKVMTDQQSKITDLELQLQLQVQMQRLKTRKPSVDQPNIQSISRLEINENKYDNMFKLNKTQKENYAKILNHFGIADQQLSQNTLHEFEEGVIDSLAANASLDIHKLTSLLSAVGLTQAEAECKLQDAKFKRATYGTQTARVDMLKQIPKNMPLNVLVRGYLTLGDFNSTFDLVKFLQINVFEHL